MPGIGIRTRGQAVLRSIRVGSAGSLIRGLISIPTTLSPAAVPAGTIAEQTFPVPGLAAGDIVISINKPSAQAGLAVAGWRVSATGALGLTFANASVAPITPTAGETYQVLIWRP